MKQEFRGAVVYPRVWSFVSVNHSFASRRSLFWRPCRLRAGLPPRFSVRLLRRALFCHWLRCCAAAADACGSSPRDQSWSEQIEPGQIR